jgi:hypothetical protein
MPVNTVPSSYKDLPFLEIPEKPIQIADQYDKSGIIQTWVEDDIYGCGWEYSIYVYNFADSYESVKKVDGVFNGDMCGASSYKFAEYKVYCDKEGIVFMDEDGNCYSFTLKDGKWLRSGDKNLFPDLAQLSKFKIKFLGDKKPLRAEYYFE